MILTSHIFDQSVMTTLRDNDHVEQDYRTFFFAARLVPVEQWSYPCVPKERV